MKQYINKQFKDGTNYIEAMPLGYPDWWGEFKEVIDNSFSFKVIMINLMGFKPFCTMPHDVNGQTVFNPLVYDFLINNPESLETFHKGHIKGLKEFKKTYFKKCPSESEVETISNLFNNKFKNTILEGQGFYNDSVIELLGFKNGILTAYWLYENDYIKEYDLFSHQSNKKQIPECLFNFLENIKNENNVIKIYNSFKNTEGKEMAILLYVLNDLKILKYALGSHKKGRNALAKCINPEINVNGFKNYFQSAKSELKTEGQYMVHEFEIQEVKNKIDFLLK